MMKKFLIIKDEVVVRTSVAMNERKIVLAEGESLVEIEAHQVFARGARAPGVGLIKGTSNKIKKFFSGRHI